MLGSIDSPNFTSRHAPELITRKLSYHFFVAVAILVVTRMPDGSKATRRSPKHKTVVSAARRGAWPSRAADTALAGPYLPSHRNASDMARGRWGHELAGGPWKGASGIQTQAPATNGRTATPNNQQLLASAH